MNTIENVFFIVKKNNLLGVIKSKKSLSDIYDWAEKYDDACLIICKYIISYKFIRNINQILSLKCSFYNGREIELAISQELKILIEKIYKGKIS